jgi:hypothetical protein
MADFDSGLPPINPPDIMRVEYRQVVGGNLLDKPTFGERLKSVLAKVGTFLGGIAGKILPFFGPFGMVGSAAAYGLQKFTQGKLDQWQAKKQYEASLDQQAAAVSNQGLYAPGFGGFDIASAGTPDSSIQVAPFARGYEQGIENTLNNKGQAAVDSVNGMQAGTTL